MALWRKTCRFNVSLMQSPFAQGPLSFEIFAGEISLGGVTKDRKGNVDGDAAVVR